MTDRLTLFAGSCGVWFCGTMKKVSMPRSTRYESRVSPSGDSTRNSSPRNMSVALETWTRLQAQLANQAQRSLFTSLQPSIYISAHTALLQVKTETETHGRLVLYIFLNCEAQGPWLATVFWLIHPCDGRTDGQTDRLTDRRTGDSIGPQRA